MDAWVWWLVAAGVLVVAEAFSASLVLGMLAGGAAAAGAAAALGGGPLVQAGTFAVVSGVLVLVVRPIARRHLRPPRAIRTGVDALVGTEAEVLETVTRRDGRIKLAGEVWSARSMDEERTHEVGSTVHVVRITGATALVD
jgi:membrane protein implicated in regulation of membrane protease activity